MLTVVAAPTTNDLTTTETAQRELRLEAQEDLDGLAELIAKASAACASWCGRPEGFGRATVTQTERLTRCADVLILARDLAPAISSVTEAGTALDADDYELDGSLLYRLSDDERTTWPAGKIVITYAAGYTSLTDLPHEIEAACLLTLAQMHAGRGENPMERRADNGLLSVSYMDTDGGIPPAAAALLLPYRRYVL
jgi:hypothetical protein